MGGGGGEREEGKGRGEGGRKEGRGRGGRGKGGEGGEEGEVVRGRLLIVSCETYQQRANVYRGRTRSDNCSCCHTDCLFVG